MCLGLPFSIQLLSFISITNLHKATDILSIADAKSRNDACLCNDKKKDNQPEYSCHLLLSYATDDFSYIPFLQGLEPGHSCSSNKQAGGCPPRMTDTGSKISVNLFLAERQPDFPSAARLYGTVRLVG